MSAATVIRVRGAGGGDARAMVSRRVEGADGRDLEARYERLREAVTRLGGWLTSPRARLLPFDAWEAMFAQYRERLEELRLLGDELRPITLRGRQEPLAAEALVSEVLELFAA